MSVSNSPSPWTHARRTEKLSASIVREILKVTDLPGIISFAGGLPSVTAFPVPAFQEAYAKVLRDEPQGALQYSASEGYGPLRESIAASLPWKVDPADVLITNGSQQGLDLISKVCIDPDSRIIVEDPTFLGALQTFRLMEPEISSVASDKDGIEIAHLSAVQTEKKARFLYVLPNFQNPTGRTMTETGRANLIEACQSLGLPILEDNPYGEIWFDDPPPLPLTARNPQGSLYLGTFSKVLAPGLRLGFMVSPKILFSKLLQAKQAADLHTPGINQRVAYEVMNGDFVEHHIPMIRRMYRSQRDAMLLALSREFPAPPSDETLTWNRPAGGMFLWAKLPVGMNATELLPLAIKRGVAFVPGTPFYANRSDPRTLRLSYVTPSVEEILRGIGLLAQAIKEYGEALRCFGSGGLHATRHAHRS